MEKNDNYLTLPDFRTCYEEDKEYGYNSSKEVHDNLFELLEKVSEKHCMYCYTNLKNDRGLTEGHLEHAIEKNDKNSILAECVPNIGLACSTCNMSFKRRGEKERKEFIQNEKKLIENKTDCQKSKCKKMCDDYKKLREKYLEKGHIILQPQGVYGKDTGCDLRIQYNLSTAEFEPSVEYGEYSEDERKFILDHINKFQLNDEKIRTQALFDFLDDTIESQGWYSRKKEYHANIIVDLFIEILDKMEPDKRMEYCLDLYSNYLVLHKIT